MRKKVVFFANTDWYLFNFRRELIEHVDQELDYQPVGFVPCGEYAGQLQMRGMELVNAKLDQDGINPFKDFLLFLQAFWVYLALRPAMTHLFTIKCVLYGGVAARLTGVPRVAAITGLGHLFLSNSLKNRILRAIIRPFFKFALGGKSARVVFQNTEDRDEYIARGLVRAENCSVIRGSGVNLDKFKALPLAENKLPTFLYIGRLLEEKGVRELIAAVSLLRKKGFEFELRLAGSVYAGNPSSLTEAEVKALHEIPYLNFLGHVSDIREEIARADVVVLPSHREGTPKSLLEAAACGRAILCSEIAGNEGVVVPDVNGYSFPVGEVETLAEAMEMMIASPETIQRYASASREVVAKEFSTDAVVNATSKVYSELLPASVSESEADQSVVELFRQAASSSETTVSAPEPQGAHRRVG